MLCHALVCSERQPETHRNIHKYTYTHPRTHRLRLVQDRWDGLGRTKLEQIQDLNPKRV